MREAKTTQIDEFEVTVQQLNGMRSLRLLHKLTRALGPAIASTGGNALKLDISSLSGAIEGIFERFSADDLESMTRELLELAQIKVGDKNLPFLGQMDVALAGRPEVILQALQFALKVNYGNFFEALRRAISARAVAHVVASPSKT